MPGARSLWIVAMKLRPVKIDEKPRTKTASAIRPTAPLGRGASTACRTSSRCRRRRARSRRAAISAPITVDVEAEQIQPRERDVLRPEHERQDEVARAPPGSTG